MLLPPGRVAENCRRVGYACSSLSFVERHLDFYLLPVDTTASSWISAGRGDDARNIPCVTLILDIERESTKKPGSAHITTVAVLRGVKITQTLRCSSVTSSDLTVNASKLGAKCANSRRSLSSAGGLWTYFGRDKLGRASCQRPSNRQLAEELQRPTICCD